MLIATNSTPGHLRLDHAVDGVDAGAADADHAQHGLVGAGHESRSAAVSGSSRPKAGRRSSGPVAAHQALEALVLDVGRSS